ncbi:hypothetical protein LCGC14_0840070 [marine sediment metagenome]|uniref:Uncharacterized protein n=1 Tax=marine sediment metagenome TaxID=412755 RepID=A0A0F9PI45_9ZZZZ
MPSFRNLMAVMNDELDVLEDSEQGEGFISIRDIKSARRKLLRGNTDLTREELTGVQDSLEDMGEVIIEDSDTTPREKALVVAAYQEAEVLGIHPRRNTDLSEVEEGEDLDGDGFGI